jgi:hypothetical protein
MAHYVHSNFTGRLRFLIIFLRKFLKVESLQKNCNSAGRFINTDQGMILQKTNDSGLFSGISDG